jgi:hypothetical protein
VVEPQSAVSVRAEDFSGDGRPDVIFGHLTATPPSVPSDTLYVNTSISGALSFSGPMAALGVAPTLEIAAADLDLNQIMDVVSLNATGTHQIFDGAGNSTFLLNAEQFSSPAPTGATVADFSNDGRPDLVVSGPSGVQLFLNDGRGNLGPGDLAPPVIQVLGQPSVTLLVGDPYADAGATATDAIDGDVTSRIVVTNPVNTAVIGTYTVTYNATDRSGNKATAVTRTVRVQTQQPSGGGGGGASGPLWLCVLALLAMLGSRRGRPSYRLVRDKPR